MVGTRNLAASGIGSPHDPLDTSWAESCQRSIGDETPATEMPVSCALEAVPVPVADVDRAKRFYTHRLGFRVDYDTQFDTGCRIVQLTPPGSACSIVIGKGIVDSEPGSVSGMLLVVDDIRAAHSWLTAQGVPASEIQSVSGSAGGSFLRFSDPDGNGWTMQESPRAH